MNTEPRNEPIAIVGSACRFAGGASSPSKLWDILQEPIDLRKEIPASRFSVEGFYHPDGSYHGHTNVRHAHFLDQDVAGFDAEFFGIKPVEVKAIDPQQRLLLEVVYEAVEAAGMAMAELKGSDTGVYVGVMFNDYAAMLLRDHQDIPTYYATGTGQSIFSNRLSYFFDWHGPSLTIDTACSSSLVAVHMAVQALRSGESRMAVACGTNLLLGPEGFIVESKLNMLSPDGRGRMWDQEANGYARGDGVATVVLKTLSTALEDGDHIEGVIRETGLNQDGATPGITMPSAFAQEALIRSTYAKAGLDLSVPCDRPQYFEAHGTGTPAGDPAEAEAIYKSFFTSPKGGILPDPLGLGKGHPLYVGSIKTVLGHTEGTAGVAAIIKACLALQQAVIPPNLLFNQLSDRVAPFYKNVEILQTRKAWPDVDGGQRRASVNSFGFGGTNAHAILESYSHSNVTDTLAPSSYTSHAVVFTPFVFSASSEHSLRHVLLNYADYLSELLTDNRARWLSLSDLAWTLRKRRSILPYRISFPALTIQDLQVKITASLEDQDIPSIGVKAAWTSPSQAGQRPARVMGVFTGQGAQYARMGAELIEQSPAAHGIIQQLESYLAEIPDIACRPSWSLEAELLAHASSSRVHEAALSQPLCTAIQILLVDLIRLAGLQFSAVVGHSSGEIGAAYAAGYLSARDAMWVAYLRGLHVSHAASPNGPTIRGAMVAVGSSFDDMMDLCEDEVFLGRVTVAATNSSSSVTLSGDEDAITEIELILDDEDKFYRRLKVDKAYHSDHMLSCFDPYFSSLRRFGVQQHTPSGPRCAWYSSVDDGLLVNGASTWGLNGTYWAENMTRPVQFSEALRSALQADSYHAVLEVGPHAALQGPTTQTIQETLGKSLPYHGLLSRGSNSINASAASLGFLWSHLNQESIDLDKYERAATGVGADHRYHLVKGLPTYSWNHEARYWHESRSSRKMRLRPNRVHPLLGDITSNSAAHHMSWKNLLRVSEMEWLSGHAVQGQVVFPAAGYVSSAIEAARLVATGSGKDVRLIEIRDFVIHQAVPFEPEDAGIEVLIEMADIRRDSQKREQRAGDLIQARFTYSAALDPGGQDLALTASGTVIIHLGDACPSLLPARQPGLPHMVDVEPERFYAALSELGYHFSGRFRTMSGLQRKRGKATCFIKMEQPGALLIHPAELDAILQSAILAYSYPYDEELRTLHLPTKIQHIRVNPAALLAGTAYMASVDATVDFGHQKGRPGIAANINLYAATEGDNSNVGARPTAAIQVQGAVFSPLGGFDEAEYRRVYSKVHWIPDRPDGAKASQGLWSDESQIEIVYLLERIAFFYLRQFDRDIPSDHPARTTSPKKWYLNHARHVVACVESGSHKWWKDEWREDTAESLLEASKPYRHLPDVEIMLLVGQQMPRVFEGETTMIEEFRAGGNDILDRYYSEGVGLKALALWVGRAVKQITDRHPHMNILEVGAGTGGATKAIFKDIGDDFLTYTYTDISAAFFENASSVFSQNGNKMIYKTLDVEKSPGEQGFAEGTYDLIVAFFVIHATSDLERSLRNLRKLLKPGGFLVIGEGSETGTGSASSGFIFGTLPGWWVGTDSGRIMSPLVSPAEWDHLLRATGFSGSDAAPPISVGDMFNVFPVVSQAVDDRLNFLREPLSPGSSMELAGVPRIKKLILVGGQSGRSVHIIDGLDTLLRHDFANQVHRFKTLDDVDFGILDVHSTVVSLTELDSPVFKDITSERFEALKRMMDPGKAVFWVTSGRLCDEPFSNMTVAFSRVAIHETPEFHIQQLDISNPDRIDPSIIAKAVLRFHATISRKTSEAEEFWTFEPEIVLDDAGRQLVPRLIHIPELNDRYNAGRRPVVRDVDLTSSSLVASLEPSPSAGHLLMEVPRYETELSVYGSSSSDTLELRTTHAIISALKTTFGHRFLVLGELAEVKYLALVPKLTSAIRIHSSYAIRCEIPCVSDQQILKAVAAQLISMASLNHLYDGQTLVAHNTPDTIAQALATQAAAKGVSVINTTDSVDGHVPASWVKLPNYAVESEVEEILGLAESTTAFAGFSDPSSQSFDNEAAMLSRFGSRFERAVTASSLYSPVATGSKVPYPVGIQSILSKAVYFAQSGLAANTRKLCSSPSTGPGLVRLGDISHGSLPPDPLCVVDWTADALLPVHATRLDAGPMFKSTGSTYWIVGMSGALGISLADWMISKGVRNLVMTSRNPGIAQEWIACHQARGAIVTIIACDVTDEAALKAAYKHISSTLPPVVGVIHGAMVLRDTSITNMSFDQLLDVTRPKVDGSIFLDRIFRDVDLDFFVLTSSINTVIGNRGQANYAAANAFMCSLAAQRRKRGLRAAAVNGGAIIGAGYMEREARRAWDKIAQNNYMMRLSEEDFVQSICECIDACRLDSPYGPEISTGLNDVPSDAPVPPFWSSDPKFAVFQVPKRTLVEDDGPGKKIATVSVLQLLQKCESKDEVFGVIKHAFAGALRAVLQVTMSDDDLMASRSSEIGLDSLVSVNIRTWFLQTLQVGIPVLKIMGNGTMENLVWLAVETVPPELVPQLYKTSEEILTVIAAPDDATNEATPDARQRHVTFKSVSYTNTPSSDRTLTSTPQPMTPDTISPMTTKAELYTSNLVKQTAKIMANADPVVDWEAEAAPPPFLLDIPHAANIPPPSSPPKVIVLTGAGGLLGHHLLAYLLQHTPSEKVICIAIRNLDSRLKNGELPPPSPRIVYHEGDLASPLLGLSPAEATSIFEIADAVIHAGADTSHMKSYHALRVSNVGSTITLARLCLPRRVPLHFVSSAGLAILSGQEAFPPISLPENGRYPASDGSFGYACAKWTCERLLEQTHKRYRGEWKVYIHRPSTIIREGSDAVGLKASLDWVNAMMKYANLSKTVPAINRNRGALDLVYVQSVCEDIASKLVHEDDKMKAGMVGYAHQVGDVVLPLDRLREFGLREDQGGKLFESVPMDEWIARAVTQGMHPAVAELVRLMDAPGSEEYPRLLKAVSGPALGE
ncbi:putative polyketide synthase [Podospora appendiculata]|uniref:Polyketide synthase n=1 Tax=Podospora appendiculata TaxID=314037 RepID=A0AAE0XB87_9PEZI|nr:putative polyketide synthase [Podospora appendiculata]